MFVAPACHSNSEIIASAQGAAYSWDVALLCGTACACMVIHAMKCIAIHTANI